MAGPRTAKALVAAMQAIWDRADGEGRDLTLNERGEVEGLLEQIEAQKAIEQKIKDLGGSGGPMVSFGGGGAAVSVTGRDPGGVFISSKQYQQVKDPAGRGQSWTSGPVDVGMPTGMQMKGTLTEGAGNPGSGTGGGLVPVPQVVDGQLPILFQPLTAESQLLSGQASSNTVQMRSRAPRLGRRRCG